MNSLDLIEILLNHIFQKNETIKKINFDLIKLIADLSKDFPIYVFWISIFLFVVSIIIFMLFYINLKNKIK